MSNQLMAGKRGLIMGLANDKSIAWGIAQACADAGAELAFTYLGDAFKKRAEPLAQRLGSDTLIDCDVLGPGLDRRGLCRNRSEMGQARLHRACHRLFRQERTDVVAMWTRAR